MQHKEDTLPHNQNLHLWQKKQSDACPLCGHMQYLIHALNNCEVALKLQRYNKCHNSILNLIVTHVENNLPSDFTITADLPEYKYCPPSLNFIKAGDLRPDFIFWSENKKAMFLCELTVCLIHFMIWIRRARGLNMPI